MGEEGHLSRGGPEVVRGPQPTMVRGNDWRKVDIPPLEEFVPTLPVTVVIPYYEASEALALTLAALEGQTYPRDLFEVIVVDDGSRIPLRRPVGTSLDVKVIHQEDRGFGAPRARNNGARAASHDILVFLDCDMLPEAGWLAAHARWHHLLSDALTLGFRAHVEVEGIDPGAIRSRSGSLEELFSGRRVDRPEWIEFHMARTNELTSTADDIFRVVTSGNLGVGKAFFESVGGFDESFTPVGGRGHRVRLPGLYPGRPAGAGQGSVLLASGRRRHPQRSGRGEPRSPAGQDRPPDRPLQIPSSLARPDLHGTAVRGHHRDRVHAGGRHIPRCRTDSRGPDT